jgi:asparagine synthase (glutamine-hydrolysing)
MQIAPPTRVQSTGTATFSTPHLAQLADNFGAGIAWRAASHERGLAAAAAQTSGAFSVGMTEADGRTSLAVDRFAIHTLCYQVVDGQLRYAPRADTLANAHTEIDPQAIFDYLFFHAIPSPRTIFKGIYRLPPGHCAVFDGSQVAVQPYWTPTFADSTDASFEDLRAEFLQLLQSAVADQLDGSKPACFLSGGTDSSTVAGMICKVSGQPAASYSIGFKASGYDEMEFARLAAKHFGAAHHAYYVTPDDLVRSIARVASHYDQPFGNSSALPAYYCAAMARADGVTRLLAGDGGDELFGGNSRYAHQRVLGWYGALPAMVRSHLIEPMLGNAVASRLPLVRKAASYVEQARVDLPGRLNMYNLLHRLGMQRVFTPDFMAQIDPRAGPAQQGQIWQEACTNSTLQRNLAFDWRYTLAENDLPKVCGTSALAGLDVGFPMLDQRLLDFSLRLPAAYKLKGLKLRWFFKEALRDFLPEAILRKKKQGFGLPFGIWACQHAGLGRLATDSLQAFGQRGIVRREFITTLLDQHLHQHPGYYGEMVWLLMMLEQWLRAHAPDYRASHAS